MDGNAVFEMFHYSENIRKQKQLMGKKPPQSSKLCPWFQPKTELRGKAIIFRLTEHAVKIYSGVH